jgi:MSHA type pilus biogenesis protein MshL
MKRISFIVWSFMVFIMLAGCGAHQQLAGQEPQPALESKKSNVPDQPVVEDETAPGPSSAQEDETGYRVRPVDIEMKQGRPYLPVGADFVTKEGKVSLGEVIKALADHKGFSVSWADDVDQQRLVDCYIMAADNFYDALDNILRQLDYFYEIKEDTIVVNYKETNRYLLAMPNFNDEFKTSLGGDMLGQESTGSTGMSAEASLSGEAKINFWDDLDKILKEIIKCDGCPAPSIDRNLGIITVRAPRRVQNEVKEYLEQLEREASRQVVVEAKIIEVALSKEHQTGIDWENVFGGDSGLGVTANVTPDGQLWSEAGGFDQFLDTITFDDTSWNLAVHAFETYGEIRIVSNPKVHILNGRSALMNVTKNMEYVSKLEVTQSSESSLVTSTITTSDISEGLSMAVKVNIINDEEVMLYIFPTVVRLIGDFETYTVEGAGNVQLATTAVRQMSTYAKVKNNQFLVIGGLIDKTDSTTTKQLPILGDIPYLGKFFSYEFIDNSSTELVILLKPKIIKNNVSVTKLQ